MKGESRPSSSIRANLLCYAAFCLAFIFILLSQPFMRIPFDIWDHLMRITSIYDTGECFIFWPEDAAFNLNLWHQTWAAIFTVLNITDVFVWAKIIHVTQFILAASSIYFFSITALSQLNKCGSLQTNRVLALFSSILWFLGNGTPSTLQQAWINWYSVTYQGLTIPLFWVAVALTLRLFYNEGMSQFQRTAHIVLVAFLSALVLFAHPTEFIFYLLYLSAFVFVNWRQGLSYVKRHALLTFWCLAGLVALLSIIVKYDLLPLPLLLHGIGPGQLLELIRDAGNSVTVAGGNRFPHALSEIAIFSLGCASLYRLYLIFRRPTLDLRVYDSLLFPSLLFVAIPMQGLLAGVFGVVTHTEIVWRFFFGSGWFIFLPLLGDILATRLFRTYTLGKVVALNASSIFLFLLLSRFFFYQSFYLNTASILHLLDRNKVGLRYSTADIQLLTETIEKLDLPGSDKTNMFYIRGDLAPIVRVVLRKYVYADRKQLPPKSTFFESDLVNKYNLVDVELPKGFPRNEDIFKYFDLEKK